MSLRSRSAILLLTLGFTLTAQGPAVAAADDEGAAPGDATTAPAPTQVPETVSATLEGLPVAYGAASVDGAGTAPGATVSAPVQAPIRFAMLGLELPPDATARIRTSTDGTTWSGWEQADQLFGGDGPDDGTAEAVGGVDASRFTEPIWVGEASWLQVELQGASPADVDATFIDTLGLAGGNVSAAATPALDGSGTTIPGIPMPGAITRAGWGADESLRKVTPSYATSVRYAVVHHTAGSNDYTEAQAPALVRGILAYHTQTLGWNDIGYNVLVDRYGNIYEGRAGGMERAVIGAHAEGFNTGSLGVSLMGEFTSVAPPQVAQDAVAQVIAWKFKRDGVDPSGGVLITSGGSNKYPAGQQVPMSTIFGHRDAGQTSCPGSVFYEKLPALRTAVASEMAAMPAPTATPTAPPAPATPTFSDIAGSVHAASIETLALAGVTGGCGDGLYCPEEKVTRGQAVSLIVRAAGLPTTPGQRFSDVPADHTHAGAIAAAVDAGFISGYTDGTFRPEALLTREQLATVLGPAAGLSRTPGQFFTDVPWTSPHLAWVNALGAAGISDGCGGGLYCPTQTTTRGQMATFVATSFPS